MTKAPMFIPMAGLLILCVACLYYLSQFGLLAILAGLAAGGSGVAFMYCVVINTLHEMFSRR